MRYLLSIILVFLFCGCICDNTESTSETDYVSSMKSKSDRIDLKAITEKDHEICNDHSPNRKDIDFCLQGVGRVTKDEKICAMIEDDNYQLWCYISVAHKTGDDKICSGIDSAYEYDIFTCMAYAKNDPGLCNKIGEEYWLNNCLMELTGEEKYCERINNSFDKSECLRDYGIINGDPSVCRDLIKMPGDESSWCFARVANKLSDPSICGELDSSQDKRYCEALAKMDLDLCNDIIDNDLRDNCVRNIIRIENNYFWN